MLVPGPEASSVLLSMRIGQSPPLGPPAAEVYFSQLKGLLKKGWTKHGTSEMNKGSGVEQRRQSRHREAESKAALLRQMP